LGQERKEGNEDVSGKQGNTSDPVETDNEGNESVESVESEGNEGPIDVEAEERPRKRARKTLPKGKEQVGPSEEGAERSTIDVMNAVLGFVNPKSSR
jgi:hypothetical protein